MARSHLKVYFDFDEKTEGLSDTEKARLLLAMYRYASTGEKPVLSGNERFAFSFIKEVIDRDIASYNAKISNGNMGGRPAMNKPKETENNLTITKAEPNETEIAKTKTKIKTKKKEPPIPPKGFDEFWSVYPKKVDKQHALKAYEKILPDDALLARMISSVKVWKNSEQWTKDNGQFIPNPATWLNGHRWEDETPNIVPIKSTGWNYEQRSYSEDELESRTDAI